MATGKDWKINIKGLSNEKLLDIKDALETLKECEWDFFDQEFKGYILLILFIKDELKNRNFNFTKKGGI